MTNRKLKLAILFNYYNLQIMTLETQMKKVACGSFFSRTFHSPFNRITTKIVVPIFTVLVISGCKEPEPGVTLTYMGFKAGYQNISVTQQKGLPVQANGSPGYVGISQKQEGILVASGYVTEGIYSIEIDGTTGGEYRGDGSVAQFAGQPFSQVTKASPDGPYTDKTGVTAILYTALVVPAPGGGNTPLYSFPPSVWGGTYTAKLVLKNGNTMTTKPLIIHCPP